MMMSKPTELELPVIHADTLSAAVPLSAVTVQHILEVVDLSEEPWQALNDVAEMLACLCVGSVQDMCMDEAAAFRIDQAAALAHLPARWKAAMHLAARGRLLRQPVSPPSSGEWPYHFPLERILTSEWLRWDYLEDK